MAACATPYYLIDEKKLIGNLEGIQRVRESSGVKCVLALKCFATWCVFDLMRKYLDGTTSSGLYEAKLGHEKFGGEVHAFSVGYAGSDIRELRKFADKVIFNSTSQLRAFHAQVKKLEVGIRVNPGISYSHYDLANPARPFSRLGVASRGELESVLHLVNGVMFHFNCENDDFEHFSSALTAIGRTYGKVLKRMSWVSLGGGISFTKPGYPVADFCNLLKRFQEAYGVQVYLEPGEATITCCTDLVTSVLDIVRNKLKIAILDISMEAHLLDHLIYRTNPKVAFPEPGRNRIMLAGRSCLAGDVFGTYNLAKSLRVGDEVRIADAAGYTMVKKNWFNGLPMPAIVVRRKNGTLDTVRRFSYEDFRASLS